MSLKYLGLPSGGNLKTPSFCEPVIHKIIKRLDGWKQTFMFIGGRVILIHSMLESILIYHMFLFRTCLKVVKLIKKMMTNILWEGSDEVEKDYLLS